ncbi:MAG: type IV pilus modification protein PilV [Bdellovibrio bacteriovorus]
MSRSTHGPGGRHPRWTRGAGFSLVEVLVAVLVLSVGLLGLAGLQIAGVRANDSARLRTQATLAAYDLADRLRADPTSFFPSGQESGGTIALDPGDCEGTQGSGDAVSRWQRDFCALGLPAPSSGDFARADCGGANPCGGGNCAIVVRWDDRRGDPGALANDETPGATDRELRFCTRIATAM